jgi:IS5 family transposase
MLGLHLLAYIYNLSEEEVCERWAENPFWQYFCGKKHFKCERPIDHSSMSKFKKPYEFGCKVSMVSNVNPAKGGHFILSAKALHGKP